jgi:hypothetical protein
VHELKGNRDAAITDYRKSLAVEARSDYSKHGHTQSRARLQALGVSIENSGAAPK